jgi:hypothetical protein
VKKAKDIQEIRLSAGVWPYQKNPTLQINVRANEVSPILETYVGEPKRDALIAIRILAIHKSPLPKSFSFFPASLHRDQ